MRQLNSKPLPKRALNQKGSVIDLMNGPEVRAYLESLRFQQKGVRATWDSQYYQLRAFFAPRDGRIDPSQVNYGGRQDFKIINEVGIHSLHILASGMLTGMSNQTRFWFSMHCENRECDMQPDVRQWFERVDDEIRKTMLKSNFYDTLLKHYKAKALYGTDAFSIEQDAQTDIVCKSFPNMSYTLAVDSVDRVDLIIREMSMTARELMEKFGPDTVSPAVKNYKESTSGGVQETYVPVCHVICRGNYFDQSNTGEPTKEWLSLWYEIGDYNAKVGLLHIGQFMESPIIVGRWDVIGENIYGESPAMDCLGSNMSLQCWEERLAQAAEKELNPPMLASSVLDPRRLTTLPGEISFVDARDTKGVFAPAYQIDFKVDAGIKMIERIEARIKDLLFVNVFQTFMESDRREITAEEIRAKMQEKLQVLGPVVERNINESLAPAVMRIFRIISRIPGRIPPMPKALQDQYGGMLYGFRPTFKSILGSAAEMVGINNIQTVLQIAGSEAALAQGTMDNIDVDETIRIVGRLANVPNAMMRTKAQVSQVRQARAQQQQQAEVADNAQKLAQAAQTAAQTPTSGGTNLLEKVAPQLAGGQ